MPTVADERDAAAGRAEKRIAAVISEAMEAAAVAQEERGSADVPAAHRQQIEVVLLTLWSDAMRSAGRSVMGNFKAEFGLEKKADDDSFFDRVLGVFAEMFGGKKITLVSDTTRAQVRDIVLRAQRNGLGIRETATEIRSAIPDASRTRAAIIARTEAHGASNFAVHEVAKESRKPMLKEWVAVEDPRTRDFGEGDGVVDQFSHRAMNGKVIPMDQPFDVPDRHGGAAQLMYPGDPNGPPGAVINCRCVLAYVRDE